MENQNISAILLITAIIYGFLSFVADITTHYEIAIGFLILSFLGLIASLVSLFIRSNLKKEREG